MPLLDTVLAPALALANRRLRQSTRALDLAGELAGRTLAIRLNQSALALALVVDPDGLRASDVGAVEPDVVIEGSLPGLLRLVGGDPQAAIRDGDVTLSGNTDLAERFQDLLRLARPDIGDELGRVLGDETAGRLEGLVRQASEVGRERLREVGDTVGRRLAAAEDLPRSDDLAVFVSGVRELRDRTARLEAALEQLRDSKGR